MTKHSNHILRDRTVAAPTSLLSRRSLIRAIGAAGGAALFAAQSAGKTAHAASRSDEKSIASETWLGTHQAGITTRPQAKGLAASFNVLAKSPAELERLFRILTHRIAFLVEGGSLPVINARFPPPDSGILGPVIMPDNLTITLAVGASLFDHRFNLADRKPARLTLMPKFPNDALNPDLCHGDILVQICANTDDRIIHALRDIIKHTPDLMALRWKQEGFASPPRSAGDSSASPRNLLGFVDGTANPDVSNSSLMQQHVWVQRNANEPAWTENGSYMVVRIIRNFVERWDRTPLQEQEAIFGRHRTTGAPLGMKGEFDVPVYADDPHGKRTRLDSHIRLANPRTTETQKNIILRRPYNYSNGITKSGQLDMGLLFICFQADLETGFATVQRRLNGEPLEEYIKPIGGGYFFALPGIRDRKQFIGEVLLTRS